MNFEIKQMKKLPIFIKKKRMSEKHIITIEVVIDAPVAKVWECMNEPNHMTKWNFAIPEWHCPSAENDLRVGGKLKARMEARDGSMGFDFEAVYTRIEENSVIHYTLGDGRKVAIDFEADNKQTKVTESFEAEAENPIEMQQAGWQMILNNFKKYVEEQES